MHLKVDTANGWHLTVSGTSEIYAMTDDGKFVARFKYARPGANAKHFVAFLTKNFTPAEYFAARENGTPPLTVLASKGYVSPNQLRALRAVAGMRFNLRAAA